MGKTRRGKRRRRTQKPKKATAVANQSDRGGGGEVQPAGDDWTGVTPAQQNQLIAQAIRWHTSATESEIHQSVASRGTLKDIAMAVIRKNLLSENERIANGALRNLIAMERMNQMDEAGPAKQVLHAHVHADARQSRLSAIASEIGVDGFFEATPEDEGEGGTRADDDGGSDTGKASTEDG